MKFEVNSIIDIYYLQIINIRHIPVICYPALYCKQIAIFVTAINIPAFTYQPSQDIRIRP